MDDLFEAAYVVAMGFSLFMVFAGIILLVFPWLVVFLKRWARWCENIIDKHN